MYEGRSAGSAQPLVWAHAEYIKLLRSVVDGKIFDTVSVVAERYAVAEGKRTFRSTIDIFQVSRPISQMTRAGTLADCGRASLRCGVHAGRLGRRRTRSIRAW